MQIVRSVLSLVAGLAAAMMLVVGLTWLFVQLMLDGDMTASPTPAYLGVNLAYSFFAAVAGGWVAARIAGRQELLHAGGVGVVMLVLSLGGDASAETGVPGWYYPAVGVLGALGAVMGGWLRQRALRPAEAPAGAVEAEAGAGDGLAAGDETPSGDDPIEEIPPPA